MTRKDFIKICTLLGIGVGVPLLGSSIFTYIKDKLDSSKKVVIIALMFSEHQFIPQ